MPPEVNPNFNSTPVVSDETPTAAPAVPAPSQAPLAPSTTNEQLASNAYSIFDTDPGLVPVSQEVQSSEATSTVQAENQRLKEELTEYQSLAQMLAQVPEGGLPILRQHLEDLVRAGREGRSLFTVPKPLSYEFSPDFSPVAPAEMQDDAATVLRIHQQEAIAQRQFNQIVADKLDALYAIVNQAQTVNMAQQVASQLSKMYGRNVTPEWVNAYASRVGIAVQNVLPAITALMPASSPKAPAQGANAPAPPAGQPPSNGYDPYSINPANGRPFVDDPMAMMKLAEKGIYPNDPDFKNFVSN